MSMARNHGTQKMATRLTVTDCFQNSELTPSNIHAVKPLVKRMIAAGHLGRKTGRGFHVYKDGKMFGA